MISIQMALIRWVLAVGGVGGHGPAGGVGELVAGAHNEGIECIGIVSLGFLLCRFGGLRFGGIQELDLDVKAHNCGKGFLKQGEIFFLEDILLKCRADVKRGHRTVEASWFDVPYPEVIGNLGEMLLAVLAGQLK